MDVKINHEYTSVACNRMPEILDWNSDGVICFGATNAVALFDTKKKGGNLITILSHHKSKVNSIKWLKKPDGTSTEFLTCSADDTAAIWTLCDNSYKVTSTLTGHLDGVTAIAGIYLNNEDDLVVFTTSIDSTIKIWERRNGIYGEIIFKQTVNLHSSLCLTLQAHLLPHSQKPVLFAAMDDHRIQLYVASSPTSGAGDVEVYEKVHALVGHEDWVRGLDVLDVDKNIILLASCSQDTYIRLWRIQYYEPEKEETTGIKMEKRLLSAYGLHYSVQLDAVLAGHEGWVYGVQWAPKLGAELNYRLLSSSLDKTLIIWEPESLNELGQPQGAWTERVRVGEVGGNGLGFYGSRFGPRGSSIAGHGYNGSLHIWACNEESNQWEPAVVCGGHFASVEDVRWEPRGRYIISASADQTTRVHAPWCREGFPPEWHELARPQIHGYDMSSVAPINGATFASAAEEKVIRVFSAPHNFFANFRNISKEDFAVDIPVCVGPQGASVPSLGLSNKAVFTEEDATSLDDSAESNAYFVPVDLTAPPTEETLMQNTLWPEIQKLYGHGFEVYTLACSPDAACLASACKASTLEHAAVIIWDTSTWQQIQKLTSHTLTVTQLAFSPDSRKLLTVSRDRRWTLYRRLEGTKSFELEACTDKTNGVHARIIWCCAWTCDSLVFGTGSRDGRVCLWTKSDQEPNETTNSSLKNYHQLGEYLQVSASVTAIAFANMLANGCRMVAIGEESGRIALYSFAHDCSWVQLALLDNSAAHHLTVRKLTFSPTTEDEDKPMMLASCGADNLVRIYNVTVTF